MVTMLESELLLLLEPYEEGTEPPKGGIFVQKWRRENKEVMAAIGGDGGGCALTGKGLGLI